jgi:hypothetical protein
MNPVCRQVHILGLEKIFRKGVRFSDGRQSRGRETPSKNPQGIRKLEAQLLQTKKQHKNKDLKNAQRNT